MPHESMDTNRVSTDSALSFKGLAGDAGGTPATANVPDLFATISTNRLQTGAGQSNAANASANSSWQRFQRYCEHSKARCSIDVTSNCSPAPIVTNAALPQQSSSAETQYPRPVFDPPDHSSALNRSSARSQPSTKVNARVKPQVATLADFDVRALSTGFDASSKAGAAQHQQVMDSDPLARARRARASLQVDLGSQTMQTGHSGLYPRVPGGTSLTHSQRRMSMSTLDPAKSSAFQQQPGYKAAGSDSRAPGSNRALPTASPFKGVARPSQAPSPRTMAPHEQHAAALQRAAAQSQAAVRRSFQVNQWQGAPGMARSPASAITGAPSFFRTPSESTNNTLSTDSPASSEEENSRDSPRSRELPSIAGPRDSPRESTRVAAQMSLPRKSHLTVRTSMQMSRGRAQSMDVSSLSLTNQHSLQRVGSLVGAPYGPPAPVPVGPAEASSLRRTGSNQRSGSSLSRHMDPVFGNVDSSMTRPGPGAEDFHRRHSLAYDMKQRSMTGSSKREPSSSAAQVVLRDAVAVVPQSKEPLSPEQDAGIAHKKSLGQRLMAKFKRGKE